MNNTYQILVVDDDFSIVNIIETALKQAGCVRRPGGAGIPQAMVH